jgi:BirA family biotin operon repressor/biotin-[acetyl-CoA-carboxylase] ligase
MDSETTVHASKIKKYLHNTDEILLEVHESLPSTNDYFKGKTIQREFEFCFAENQTKGRGRLGRTWHSPSGVNLMFSCRWQLPSSLSQLQGLSSCISLSLISALNYLAIPNLMCKWPNDLYYQDKKLAGILIELYATNGKISQAIIGIGLNVNMEALEIDIEKPWTSLKKISGINQDRNLLAARIIESLIHYLNRFSQKRWVDFMPEWTKYDYLKGKEVSIPIGLETITGEALGVDENGGLLIRTSDKKIISCSSGEVEITLPP